MVAPSISGVTLLRNTNSSTGIVSSDTTITVTPGTTFVIVSSLNTTTGVELWVEFPTDSTFDLTGRGFFFGFRHNITLTAASFAFLSANGERRWNITSGSGSATEFYLDAQGSGFADTGTFDITAVNKIRLYVTGAGSTSREVYLYRPYSYLKSVGVIFNAGDVSTPVTPGSTYTLIQSLLNGAVDGAELISGNYVGMPVPLTLSPTVSSFLNGCIAFQPNAYSVASNNNLPRISLTNRVFRVDSAASQIFSGVQFVGTASEEFTFADVSAFSNTYSSDMLILRHSTVSLGLAVFNGVLASGTGTITGGTSFGGAVRSNTASYAIEWNGSTTFAGLNLTGTTNAHFINCNGANFTTGATLDVTNITFGTPGTKKIRVDAAGKTLNISTAGNITISDVTIVAGTVNIVTPTASVTLTGLVATSKVKIYAGAALFTGVDSSGTTFNWTGTPGVTYTIRIVLPGYESQEISYVYPSSSTSLPISQAVDTKYTVTSGLTITTSAGGSELGVTADIWYDITNKKIFISSALNINSLTGISGGRLYSKTVESRYANDSLMPFHRLIFATDLDAGKLEINAWSIGDATSRNLIRDVGIDQYSSVGGTLQASYIGLFGLGSILSSEVPYYVQSSATNATIVNAVNPGLPNQLVQTYGDASNGNFDLRTAPFRVLVRSQGRNVAFYDLKAEQNVTTLKSLKYSVPLATSVNTNLTIADTAIDFNSNGVADIAPYTGMSLTWLTSAATPDWANATVYAPYSYVESASKFYITVLGGTSSGTGVANDTGVVWYEINTIYQANGGNLTQMTNYLFWAQRQNVDIDAGTGNRTGRIVDTLASTRGSTLVLRPGLWAIGFDIGAQLTHIPTTVNGTEVPYPPPPGVILINGVPNSANVWGIEPASTIAFYDPSDGNRFIAAIDGSDYEYVGDGNFNVLSADFTGSLVSGTEIVIVADAVGWRRTPPVTVDTSNQLSVVNLAPAFAEHLNEAGVAIIGSSSSTTGLNFETPTRIALDVASGGAGSNYDLAGVALEIEFLTSGKFGLETYDTDAIRDIQYIINSAYRRLLLPAEIKITAAIDATTSPVIDDFATISNDGSSPFVSGLSSTAPGLTTRPNVSPNYQAPPTEVVLSGGNQVALSADQESSLVEQIEDLVATEGRRIRGEV